MAGVAGRSGRGSSYSEILANDCVDQGLRALQLSLQDTKKTPEEKWQLAQPLVLKKTRTEIDVTATGDLVLNIVKNSTEKTKNVVDDAPVEQADGSV